MVLVSAAAFGTLAILAKVGYASGMALEQMLAFRFAVAALGMWILALAARQNPFRAPRRRLAALLAMGCVGYSGQAFTFFSALRSLPASLVELILYTYPALVALAGWIFFRHRVGAVHAAALAASFAGVALLLGGVSFQSGSGLLFAVAAPCAYTVYIVVGDRVMPGVPALAAGAVTISGSAATFAAVAAMTHRLHPPPNGLAWGVVLALAVVPTMIAITLFLAALPRIGGGRAALLSTFEPLVTVVLAVVVLGDRLQGLQLVGAATVLGSVVALQWPAPKGPNTSGGLDE